MLPRQMSADAASQLLTIMTLMTGGVHIYHLLLMERLIGIDYLLGYSPPHYQYLKLASARLRPYSSKILEVTFCRWQGPIRPGCGMLIF